MWIDFGDPAATLVDCRGAIIRLDSPAVDDGSEEWRDMFGGVSLDIIAAGGTCSVGFDTFADRITFRSALGGHLAQGACIFNVKQEGVAYSSITIQGVQVYGTVELGDDTVVAAQIEEPMRVVLDDGETIDVRVTNADDDPIPVRSLRDDE